MRTPWFRGIALAAVAFACCAGISAGDPADLMPAIAGFTPTGDTQRYDPDTLFEYVNGDAFNYVNFNFVDLAVREFRNDAGAGVTVEIFRHAGLNDAFGIYGYERPSEGPFLEIGAQGYHEPGLVHFFKGDRYVKLKGSGLGEKGRGLLIETARGVAARIAGEPAMPPALALLPETGRVAYSERFIARSFLGHGFLRSVFTADYRTADGEVRLFLVEAGDEAEAGAALEAYLELARKRGEELVLEDGVYRFHDPYHRSDGPLHLKRHGRHLFGLFAEDETLARDLLHRLEKNLS